MNNNAEIDRLKADIAKLEAKLAGGETDIHELRRQKAKLVEQLRKRQTDDRVILG